MICGTEISKILIISLLILCSSGMESRTGGDINSRIGKMKNTPFDVSNCADDYPLWCKHKKSLCSSLPSVTIACQGTCGLCSNKCQDMFSTRKCVEYSKTGYCRSSKFVQLNCKKTCEKCIVDNCTDKEKVEIVAEKPKGRGCDCGLENVQSKSKNSPSGHRIVGGTEAGRHSLPWMVYIVNEKVPGSPRCGGSIINSHYILTAAHCTYESNCQAKSKASHFIVTVAEHNVNSINDDVRGATEKITVEKIIRHEKYCMTPKKPFDNDIALFRLSKEIDLLEYPEIGIICLPNSIMDDYYSSKVIVAGWGFLKNGAKDNNRFASTLQIVKLNRIDCGDFPMQDQITVNMICAGDQANIRDACGGDSGGPLTVRIDVGDGRVRHIQIGIVSFGVSHFCDGRGVYTKVQNYLHWIRSNIPDGGCDNVTDAGYQTMPDEELKKHQELKREM